MGFWQNLELIDIVQMVCNVQEITKTHREKKPYSKVFLHKVRIYLCGRGILQIGAELNICRIPVRSRTAPLATTVHGKSQLLTREYAEL